MTKNDGMYYALGIIKGNFECNKDWATVNLGEIFGSEKYSRYEIGLSNGNSCVALMDIESPKEHGMRRRVIEVNRHIYLDDLVHLLFDALAMDIKLRKDELKEKEGGTNGNP